MTVTTRQLMGHAVSALLVLVAPRVVIAGQATPSSPVTLTVGGDVTTVLSLTAGDLKGFPRVRAEAKAEDRTTHAFERVLGKPPSGSQCTFRMVAPKDARGARSVRMLQRLDVVRLRK